MPQWAYVVFLLAAGAGLAFISRHHRPGGWPLWMFVAVSTLTTVVAALAWEDKHDYPAQGAVPRREPSDGYVTSATCRSCHAEHYASWHRSYHRTMTQVVSPATVLAPFTGQTIEHRGARYRFTRVENQFFVEIARPKPDGQLVSSGPMKVVLSTGSHHYQVYWVDNGDPYSPLEINLYWNIQLQRFIGKTDTLLTPPGDHDSPGTWNVLCIRCHSVNGKPNYDPKLGRYTSQVSEYGIACESCHGPGAEHVRKHRNPLARYGDHFSDAPDPTIVNPAKLSAAASSQVCGRCHGNYWQDVEHYVLSGFPYRPGEDLTQVAQFHDADRPRPGDEDYVKNMSWGDGTTRTGGDEYNAHMKSPCFTAGELSCVSCHSLHDSDPNDQLAKGMEGNGACLQCHEEFADKLAAHTHHPADSPGSLCYNCHMPNTTWALSTAMRSHRIDVPNIEQSARTGRPNACNLCHLDKTLAWSSAKLSEWYGAPPATLDAEQQQLAASVSWLIKGNAIQRAIAAWHMGWEPAVQATGSGFQAALLAEMLDDPYSQVRFVAGKALERQPGLERLGYDFVAPREAREQAAATARGLWRSHGVPAAHRTPALLIRPDGELHRDQLLQLRAVRDDTPIDVPE